MLLIYPLQCYYLLHSQMLPRRWLLHSGWIMPWQRRS